jgi:hypothetical protein
LKQQSSDSERVDVERDQHRGESVNEDIFHDGRTSKKLRNHRDASEISSASFNECSNVQTYFNNNEKRNSRLLKKFIIECSHFFVCYFFHFKIILK